jgi:alkanesulfonate monooxygenase SsuD/methylene tetrahydromethanopterin reductase-like flavin-dependent oxidoreductase (luciferase family)
MSVSTVGDHDHASPVVDPERPDLIVRGARPAGMDFAVNVPTSAGASEYSTLAFCDEISWPIQRDFAVAMEELGYDGVAVPDHLMTGDGATTECLTTVTGLAGATEEVYLYPKTVNDQLRHGPLIAKTAATVDHVSDGRLKLGLGAGWKEDEARAYGYDWPPAPERLRELEETVEVTRRLWTRDEVSYDGEFHTLDGAVCKPHPVQDPHPPIMIGGGGEEFTLRIAAKHADSWNYWGSPAVMARKDEVLREHCETYDRDYEEIETSWFCRCVIRESEDEVETLLADVPRFRPENFDDETFHLVGTPDSIVEDLREYERLGFEEVVVEFVDFPETTGAEIFAERVMPAFD